MISFVKAFVTNMAVSAVWYVLEYQQFGELQLERSCDNAVWYIYLFILWYLFHEKEVKQNELL